MQSIVKEYSLKYIPTQHEPRKLQSPNQIFEYVREIYNPETAPIFESFYVVYLNQANMVKGFLKVSDGCMNATLVDVRLIMMGALDSLATAIVLTHNHPSGEVNPSRTDKELTKKLQDAASLFDIVVLDHVIVDGNLCNYHSFANNLELERY